MPLDPCRDKPTLTHNRQIFLNSDARAAISLPTFLGINHLRLLLPHFAFLVHIWSNSCLPDSYREGKLTYFLRSESSTDGLTTSKRVEVPKRLKKMPVSSWLLFFSSFLFTKDGAYHYDQFSHLSLLCFTIKLFRLPYVLTSVPLWLLNH